MNKRIVVAASVALLALGALGNTRAETPEPSTTSAPDARAETPGTVIPLKDGGRIIIDKNGRTYHQDAAGGRVRMRDGVTMEGADGARYTMKNDAVWRTITERGTLSGK